MSGKWKQYTAYRDSDAPRIGRIPEGWDTIELRRLVAALRPITYGIVQPGALDPSGIPMVRGQDYSGGWVSTERMFHVSPEIELPYRRSRLAPNDILMTIVGAGVGNVATVPDWLKQANITQTTARIAVDGRLASHRFIAYALRSNVGQACVRTSTKGAAQPGLTLASVSRFRIPLPPLDAQQSIAAFLDRETAKIDALVAKKERLIELLQEKRTALISHAVTQGLNPNAPLRDSGIPWLGHIPQHWRTRRLAMVTSKITNGFVGPTRDILVDDGIRYLQSLHIKDGSIRFNTPYFVRPQWSADHAKSILAEGDVLIVQTGDLGQCAAVPRDFVGANCHALIIVRLRPHVGSGRFLSAFLRSHYGQASLRCCETGATLPHLECGKIREIQIALPPESEQDQIMNELEAMTAKLDALKAKTRTAIDRLQEYRTALISAAVTGQIDVREAA